LKIVLLTEKRKPSFIPVILFLTLAIVLMTSQIPASNAVTNKVLASGQSYPTAIVENGKSLYWSDFGSGTINMVDKTGGSSKVVIPGDSGPVEALEISGGYIYWTNVSGLYKVATSGGSVEALDTGAGFMGAVISGTTIYFILLDNIYEISTTGGNLKELLSGQSLGTPFTLIKEGNYLVTYNYGNGSIAFVSLITDKVVSQPFDGIPHCSNIIESGIVNMFFASGFVYFTETGVCSTYEVGILGNVSMTRGEENMYAIKEPQVGALLNGIALLPGASPSSSQIVFGQTVPGEGGVYSLPLTGGSGPPKLLFSLEAEGVTVASKVIYATGSSEVVSSA
jgi:hypothetical protein